MTRNAVADARPLAVHSVPDVGLVGGESGFKVWITELEDLGFCRLAEAGERQRAEVGQCQVNLEIA